MAKCVRLILIRQINWIWIYFWRHLWLLSISQKIVSLKRDNIDPRGTRRQVQWTALKWVNCEWIESNHFLSGACSHVFRSFIHFQIVITYKSLLLYSSTNTNDFPLRTWPFLPLIITPNKYKIRHIKFTYFLFLFYPKLIL